MSEYLDRKYINLVSGSLERFAWVGNSAKFRCPFCGDSQKHQQKTRGYVYWAKPQGGTPHYRFKCFNCSEAYGFSKFLERVNVSLFNDYRIESLKEYNSSNIPRQERKPVEKRIVVESIQSKGLSTPLSGVSVTSEASKWFAYRQIPNIWRKHLLFAENFKKYAVEEFLVGSDKQDFYEGIKLPNDKRIIIPYKDRSGNCFCVQGRSLASNDKLRYITVRYHDDVPKIYGLERHDINKPTFLLEGPIDSLFLPNALAIGGAGISESMIETIGADKKNLIVIYDNEPRNKEILKHIENAIEFGLKVVIWKNIPVPGKDINEMILNGLTRSELIEYIARNHYVGSRATLEFNQWKKL